MKYFNIEEKSGMSYSWESIKQAEGFPKILNCEEKRRVLEEQLRPHGLQPIVNIDNSGIEIIEASKKFAEKERRYNNVMSKRAQEYIAFIKSNA